MGATKLNNPKENNLNILKSIANFTKFLNLLKWILPIFSINLSKIFCLVEKLQLFK